MILPVAPHANAIAAPSVIAPPSTPVSRVVHEDEATGGVTAHGESSPAPEQFDDRQREIVDEAIPIPIPCGDVGVDTDMKRSLLEEPSHVGLPTVAGFGHIPNDPPNGCHAAQLAPGRLARRHTDVMIAQVPDGIGGVGQMIVIGLVRSRPCEPMSRWTVARIGDPYEIGE
jgi:hypothetical protein